MAACDQLQAPPGGCNKILQAHPETSKNLGEHRVCLLSDVFGLQMARAKPATPILFPPGGAILLPPGGAAFQSLFTLFYMVLYSRRDRHVRQPV